MSLPRVSCLRLLIKIENSNDDANNNIINHLIHPFTISPDSSQAHNLSQSNGPICCFTDADFQGVCNLGHGSTRGSRTEWFNEGVQGVCQGGSASRPAASRSPEPNPAAQPGHYWESLRRWGSPPSPPPTVGGLHALDNGNGMRTRTRPGGGIVVGRWPPLHSALDNA